jgi:hypothetical protein
MSAQLRALSGESPWFGVTYHEDMPLMNRFIESFQNEVVTKLQQQLGV